jgi:allophanate hydrolase
MSDVTNATIEVAAPGALATIQDLGRIGWRRFGVPRSGALDPALLRIANTLAGNAEGAAAIEFFVAGPTLKAAEAPVRLGLAGDFEATLQRTSGERSRIDSWRSVTLLPGEQLRVGQTRGARAGVVAVHGLEVPATLGSASTYTRARFGGQGGRALAAGDKLKAASAPVKTGAPVAERLLGRPPSPASGPIRVVPGPQSDYFDAAQIGAFFAAEYRVSADADRMGLRLQGPALVHRAETEIVSDATVPGSIQVPGNGLPIVLLADGQTAGGYPKIGTVASADLARLALAPVGSSVRFARVSVAEAEAAARAAEVELRALLASVRTLALDGDVDLEAIYTVNLVSGMINALDTA